MVLGEGGDRLGVAEEVDGDDADADDDDPVVVVVE